MRGLITCLLLAAAIEVSSEGATLETAPPARTVVPCDSTKSYSETIVEVGEKCTSSQPLPTGEYETHKKQEAVDDANNKLRISLTGRFTCAKCPDGEFGCTNDGGVAIVDDYEMSDCTFNGPPYTDFGCGGNPFKRLITATCTKTIDYSYSCSGCEAGGGDPHGGQ